MNRDHLLTEDLAIKLTDGILNGGKWAPGEKLPGEKTLADTYGVSRNTIREAIKLLNERNILVTKPHSGTYVSDDPGAPKDPFCFGKILDQYQRMLDLYELRIVVESAAAAMVVQRASDEEIKEILLKEEICRGLILEKKPWSEADRAFHASIAEACHNTAFVKLVPSMHLSALLGYNMLNEERNKINSLKYHRLIAEGIARRDEAAAADAVRCHLKQAIDDLKFAAAEEAGAEHRQQ